MFKIAKERTYEFPVDVKLPKEDRPGRYETHRFHVTFEALPVSESRELVREIDDARRTGDDSRDLDRELMRRVMKGWRGVEETFDEDTLELAINDPFVLRALVEAYRKSVNGEQVQARREGN